MRRLLLALLLASPLARADDEPGPIYAGLSWDLQLEVGYTFALADEVEWPVLGRARGGVLWVQDPYWWAFGVIADVGGQTKSNFGLQAELTHLERGLWAQTAAGVSHEGVFTLSVAAGFTLLGVEYQGAFLPDPIGPSHTLTLKLRIPIGHAVFGLTHRAVDD